MPDPRRLLDAEDRAVLGQAVVLATCGAGVLLGLGLVLGLCVRLFLLASGLGQ